MTDRKDCECPRARHEHGTKRAYFYDKCRCPPCRAANTAEGRAYRRKHAERRWNGGTDWTDSIGTRRRLQALAVAGWSLTALGPHLGISTSGVGWLRQIEGPCLHSTARRVATAYDQLWDQRPEGSAVTRTRAWALRRGWVPALAWDDDTIDAPAARPQARTQTVDRRGEDTGEDIINPARDKATRRIPSYIDEIAVERAMRGDPVHLTKQERSEAVAKLTAWKYSATEIAERLQISDRTVVRRRSAAA